MPIVMFMEWDGVTLEQYDAVRKLVKWETEKPHGGIFHVAAFSDKALRITDLWESAEAFQTFVEKRLTPGVKKAGIAGEPKVEIYPVHALFTPGYKPV